VGKRAEAQFNVVFDRYDDADWWLTHICDAYPDDLSLKVEQQGRTVTWNMDLGAQAPPVLSIKAIQDINRLCWED
jgi:hypothetical protein